MCPSKTIHLSPSGLARPSTTPLLILLAICRSTDQTAFSHGEWWEWGWWRSALDPFNTSSTSNNSRLWQLCIIHLVESLSLSSLTLLSPSPLSVSLQLFFFFFFPPCLPALGEGERENQGSVPSDAARFPLTPVILETQKCLSAARCPDPENSACHLNQIVFVLYWGSMPKSLAATWSVDYYLKIHNNQSPPSVQTINFWLADLSICGFLGDLIC